MEIWNKIASLRNDHVKWLRGEQMDKERERAKEKTTCVWPFWHVDRKNLRQHTQHTHNHILCITKIYRPKLVISIGVLVVYLYFFSWKSHQNELINTLYCNQNKPNAKWKMCKIEWTEWASRVEQAKRRGLESKKEKTTWNIDWATLNIDLKHVELHPRWLIHFSIWNKSDQQNRDRSRLINRNISIGKKTNFDYFFLAVECHCWSLNALCAKRTLQCKCIFGHRVIDL